MRYEVRFGNGYWRVFDTHHYTTVCLCPTQVWAVEAAVEMNFKRSPK